MEDFVTFEIAKKLKEKEFREKCLKHYIPNTEDGFLSPFPKCYNDSGYLDAAKNHFDYRGLIPMGLAIDCTNLNIY